MTQTIGILGGTGPAGRGLAVRLSQAGYTVLMGSRDAARAQAVATELGGLATAPIHGASNEDAAGAELVIVATPWESAVETVTALREPLAGKVVISMVNALTKRGREMVPLFPARGSMAAEIAAALPHSRVVGAFHHLPASAMEDPESGLDADVVIVGDDPTARQEVVALTNAMDGLTAVEAGSLALAGTVEAFTAVCISVNIRHKAHSYVRLMGLR
jgi:NADPH-dependent F420 reductase